MPWVTLETFNSRVTADLVRSLLEDNQVAVRVRADDAGGTRPDLALSRGVDLQVEETDLARARRLLAQMTHDETP